MQTDVGVIGSGGGVAHFVGRLIGVGRVADVPALHIADIHAAGGDRRTIGTPPMPAVTMHLLRGDEVGASPRDSWVVLRSELPAAAIEFRDS